MKLDTHQHFWRYDAAEMTWISDRMSILRRDFLPADLAVEQVGAGFGGSIAVQARQSIRETRWLLELSAANPRIRGVVGWLDLRSDHLEADLDSFAADPRLRGLRHVLQDEPDDRFMLREDFLRGLRKLRSHGLTYDILIFARHLPQACELAARLPEQPFVLDHIAKPNIAAGELDPWADGIRRLAKAGNVYCKLSGMVTEADWHAWQPADFRPYLDVVFEAFGPGRLMIGSDWPVCTLAASYARVMRIVTDYISQCSADEQANILGQNAARFYGIRNIA
jgi:L-fuconolactonase